MLTLRPCCSSSLLRCIIFPFRRLSSRFSFYPNINKPITSQFIVKSNSHSTMSKPRSAFDVLMAKSKKTPSQSQSPKKRKSPDSQIAPKTLNNSSLESVTQQNQNPVLESDPKPQNSISQNPNSLRIENSKKQRLAISELKGKIKSLMKNPKDFDPNEVVCWEKGDKVPFIFVCSAFEYLEAEKETGRGNITNVACNMLRTVMSTTPDDLLPLVYLLANRVAPAHEGVELGIGEAMIIKALAEAFGRTEKQVKKEYEGTGDLGCVAQASRSSQTMMRKPDPLTVAKVFSTFQLIAKESGKDSQDKKKNRIKALLVAATDCEPQYLIRLLQGRLRINLAGQTLLTALGQAFVFSENHCTVPSNVQSPSDEAAKIVKQVYSLLPVYDRIVPALLNDGVWNLSKTCDFTPGVPVGPMLAKPAKSVIDIVEKFQGIKFTCEYKYDGERAQIHFLEDNSVEIYSRNAERNTGKYPDVVAAISRLRKSSVKSFVLDCEIVAFNRAEKRILPFQILSTRPRKNVVMSDIKIDVCIFAFDMLYLNGKPLIEEQLEVRRKWLYDSFEEDPEYLQFATAIISNDLEEIQKFLDAAVDARFLDGCTNLAYKGSPLENMLTVCEGLIIKTLDKDATYEPSKRSNNWVKLKKDYIESIGDSLDLVPIAAFHGRGKRTGVYGAFLLACYNSSTEEYESICKIGTGFSEQVLEERSDSLRSKVVPQPRSYYRYEEKIKPDVWFEPSEVWEVKAADLTISPVHRAAVGIVNSDKGISLRFPRLMRVREDKSPEDATTSEQVADMYTAQKQNQHNVAQANSDDDL